MKIQAYKTIKFSNEFEVKEKKSIFFAKSYPVSTESEAAKILNDLKKQYYDATHRCYAYRLISGKLKLSDAGEPPGTAGIRILNAIDHFELQDCLVAVIRYFGGTKLGIGSLGKAYYSAAFNALHKSQIITKQPYVKGEISIDISSFGKLNKIFTSNNVKIIETTYNSEIGLKCLVPLNTLDEIKAKITDIFKGKAFLLTDEEIFFE